jgi:hypothetical protein
MDRPISHPVRTYWFALLCTVALASSAHAQTSGEAPAAPSQQPTGGVAPPPSQSLEDRVHFLEQRLQQVEAKQALPPITSQVPPASEKGAPPPPPPEATPVGEPFAWGDFTWLNGGTRQTEGLLSTNISRHSSTST